jgi:hypothetical protein
MEYPLIQATNFERVVLPQPLTPISSICPWGWRRARSICSTWSNTSSKRTKSYSAMKQVSSVWLNIHLQHPILPHWTPSCEHVQTRAIHRDRQIHCSLISIWRKEWVSGAHQFLLPNESTFERLGSGFHPRKELFVMQDIWRYSLTVSFFSEYSTSLSWNRRKPSWAQTRINPGKSKVS